MSAILLVKETRADERRVALIPEDVKLLIANGATVYVEHNAGLAAGFADEEYEVAGAKIRFLSGDNMNAYMDLFSDIDIIVRAKRPDRPREVLENQTIRPGTVMIGALDPLEKASPHQQEYADAKIKACSIDQLDLPLDHPMNVLSAMSKMAGELALLDAVECFDGTPKTLCLIGFGVVGQSAFETAIRHNMKIHVIARSDRCREEIENAGGKLFTLDASSSLEEQQDHIADIAMSADIIITSARRANEVAPILIPNRALQKLKPGTIVVDMSLSEGGNVEGSEHDQTLVLPNGVSITNKSGYPKVRPQEASILWSKANYLYLMKNFTNV